MAKNETSAWFGKTQMKVMVFYVKLDNMCTKRLDSKV